MAAPTHLLENAPDVAGVISDTAFDLDQLGYPAGRPQPIVEAESLWTALESSLDTSQILAVQTWRTAHVFGSSERATAALLELASPAADRLPVDTDLACYFGLRPALTEQRDRFHSPPFERVEIPFDTSWVSHATTIQQLPLNVTMFCKAQ